jgi:glutamate-5-semialdehyde dehydrogenase
MTNKIKKLARKTKEASYAVAALSHRERNAILKSMARNLIHDARLICRENAKDLANAKKIGIKNAMFGRLTLTPEKIKKISIGIKEISALPDPLGRVLETIRRPNGLVIRKCSVPLGVLLIIYESRPNVTADCAALAIKSGNAVILKGGREALYSNQAIHQSLIRALKTHHVSESAILLVPSASREAVHQLLSLNDDIDVVIPRGGEGLIRKVAQISKIPVIKHYKGVCHVYVDRNADLKKALAIAENAKVQNPGVCNTMETLLVHQKIAPAFLRPFYDRMKSEGVELRGCPQTRRILKGIKSATQKDWHAEYLDLKLAVRVVPNLEEAIRHIHQYGSSHTDTIVSQNKKTLDTFALKLDSACIFTNASTRFSDGGEFGMGAEIGISTDKLHARGPMGLRELTTYKYIVTGNGQIRL